MKPSSVTRLLATAAVLLGCSTAVGAKTTVAIEADLPISRFPSLELSLSP